MARIRTIKPEFFTHEALSGLPEITHYGMAAGLLTYADDEGYFNANIGLIKAALFPLRESSVSIHEMLTQLSNIDFLRIYEGKDGRRYGHIVNFLEHQRVNRPTPSKIKQLIIITDDSVSDHGLNGDDSLPEGKGREGKAKAKISSENETAFISIPCIGGDEYAVTDSQCAEWGRLFPAVNVQQELRKMRAWSLANPTRRKTSKGIQRFITSWLMKEQDNGGTRPKTERSMFAGAK